MKFGVGFRYERLCGEPEFRENRLSNIHSLLLNVREFLPVNFHVFFAEFDEILQNRSFHVTPVRILRGSLKIGAVKRGTFLRT